MKMNYNWGYLLTKIYAFFGFFLIFISLLIGVAFIFGAPRGMGYFGFVIMLAGFFQGAILLGFGSIGKAILDGSEAQQGVLKLLIEINKNIDFTEVKTYSKEKRKAENSNSIVSDVQQKPTQMNISKSIEDDWSGIV